MTRLLENDDAAYVMDMMFMLTQLLYSIRVYKGTPKPPNPNQQLRYTGCIPKWRFFVTPYFGVDRVEGGGRISGKQFAVVSGVDVGACVGGSVSETQALGTITYPTWGKEKSCSKVIFDGIY